MPTKKSVPAQPTLDHKINTKVTTEIVDLTPALAEKFLGQNIDNRNVRPRKVLQYARDMRNGKWQMSNDAVTFNWNGRMDNGQHRCLAVIESGTTIRVIVVKGFDPEAREVMDTGAKRSGADALRFAGFTQNPNMLAALARVADARENGYLKTAMATSIPDLTNSDILAWAELNPDASHAIALSKRTASKMQITPSTWAYCLYEFEKLNGPAAIEFAESTADMRGFTGRDDPRKVMLDIFQRAAVGQRRKPGTAETIYIVFRAWNAWIEGQNLKLIVPGKANTDGNDIPKLRAGRARGAASA